VIESPLSHLQKLLDHKPVGRYHYLVCLLQHRTLLYLDLALLVLCMSERLKKGSSPPTFHC
jgi:hypothetical protein